MNTEHKEWWRAALIGWAIFAAGGLAAAAALQLANVWTYTGGH